MDSFPLYGVVIIECDSMFEFELLIGNLILEPATISPGAVQWIIEDQQPFSSALYQIHVAGPGVEFVAEIFPFVTNLLVNDQEGTEFYNNSWTLFPTVVCAYDPNDKCSTQPGYTDENHFILADDEIEFRVRFQNTGNFPAQTVVIRDTLDLIHLDIERFYPVFVSHDYMATVEPNGVLAFTFNNIMMPDSTSEEPGSKGYVVFRIRPRDDLQHMDVIHNTAYIFFDANPAIVTDTTWQTIMDCNTLTGIASENSFCVGDVAYCGSEQPFIDNYSWSFDSELISNDTSLAQSLTVPGLFNIDLVVSNQLCEFSDQLEYWLIHYRKK